MISQESYSYAAQPHAAPIKTKKYRDENDNSRMTRNIMSDSRVIRGNTYAAKSNLSQDQLQTTMMNQQSNRISIQRKSHKFIGKRVSTPPPLHGRSHADIQTEEYLEVLTDRPIEVDSSTQTNAFMDRPRSPLFVPAKTGVDVETEILPGELFNFEFEVEPILEVLVGKTIHMSMLEVLQEEELESIQQQQAEFETIRDIEKAEVQRLEAEIRRKAAEKERRIEQEKQQAIKRRELEEKIAARNLAREYLNDLHINVFQELESQGVFYDPLEKEIQDIYLADVINQANIIANAYDAACFLAQEIIGKAQTEAVAFEEKALKLRQEYYDQLAAEAAALVESQRLLEEEKLMALEEERMVSLKASEDESGDPEESEQVDD